MRQEQDASRFAAEHERLCRLQVTVNPRAAPIHVSRCVHVSQLVESELDHADVPLRLWELMQPRIAFHRWVMSLYKWAKRRCITP